ncbi:hypothetical protein [Stigmatella aurantiaca]|uniref:hypothetical protein n=1 Tax=Stigmatella aurantiaca TaxID=41 RepID=UPI000673F97D|nr:hypothetical protein [Stigmatella aurantiaca]
MMLKLIFSIIGGMLIAFALVFATDALFHSMSSSPAPADTNDREAMQAYLASQPSGALLAVLVGWAVAAFAGAALAARLGGRGPWPGWVVAGLFFLATVFNFLIFPHPAWMVLAGIVLIIAAGWFGSRVGTRRSADPRDV